MRTNTKRAIALATVAAMTVSGLAIQPAAAAPRSTPAATQGPTAEPATEISAQRRRHYRHRNHAAGAAAMLGVVGTIAGIAAAERARRDYRRHYYYGGSPYGYGYQPYAYGPPPGYYYAPGYRYY
jgi:hypothetical protein